MNAVLPADVFWLLRVPVAPGGSTPFVCWCWWHWQFLIPHAEVEQ